MIYSNQFLLILEDIDKNNTCGITKFLLENKKIKLDITWINIENDYITYIPTKKLNNSLNSLSNIERNMLENEFEFERNMKMWIKNGELITIKIKIGRFIRRLSEQFTDSQIEQFVNKLKGFFKLKIQSPIFEIISGEEIKKYYSEDSYKYNRGQLGLSCMKYDTCQNYLDIYTKNKDICKLLILKNNNKIIGRALLWTLTNGDLYLDRIYTNFDFDIIVFEEYVKKLGCKLFYSKIFSDSYNDFIELTIKPKYIEFNLYPYMDTFRYFYPLKKIFNSEIIIGNNDYYDMDITDGKLPNLASYKPSLPLRNTNIEIQAA